MTMKRSVVFAYRAGTITPVFLAACLATSCLHFVRCDRVSSAVQVEVAIDDAGWCYFASSNFSFVFPRGEATLIYRKGAFREAFDDLCVDGQGRLWMTDPTCPTLKVYDPADDSLVRIRITGFGQASSRRIRVEEGREILYVTELFAPERDRHNRYNGRGVLRVALESVMPD